MYLLNKKQQKTDRKIGVFCESPSRRGVNWNKKRFSVQWFVLKAPPAGAWIEMGDAHYIMRTVLKKPLPQGRELK